jgi:hypothetical protein
VAFPDRIRSVQSGLTANGAALAQHYSHRRTEIALFGIVIA